MQKFIPRNYKELDIVASTLITVFAVVFAILVLFVESRWDLILLVALCDLPLFCIGLYCFFRKPGLYIENDKLIFKNILQKRIDIKDVAGLLILKSEFRTKHSYHYMKNGDKNFRYSIIYLKEFDYRFADFNMGDIRFMSLHREDAYFYTVYDEEVIELFKGKIPIIVCKQKMQF